MLIKEVVEQLESVGFSVFNLNGYLALSQVKNPIKVIEMFYKMQNFDMVETLFKCEFINEGVNYTIYFPEIPFTEVLNVFGDWKK